MDKTSQRVWSRSATAVLTGWLAAAALPAQADVNPRKVLDAVYSGYDRAHQCWISVDKDSGRRYCMKLDHTEKVSADTGQRLYLLVAGEAVNDAGEPDGSHAEAGLVGAFVIEERNGRPEIIAGEPALAVGASGSAPVKWKLVKLGPSDYWGWINQWGDCHQGYCGTRQALLAPFGRKVRDLAGFAVSFSNSGACADKRCERNATELDSVLEIDTTRIGEKVFPLVLTVKGAAKGRKMAPTRYTMPFDAKKWSYVPPADWPLKDADF